MVSDKKGNTLTITMCLSICVLFPSTISKLGGNINIAHNTWEWILNLEALFWSVLLTQDLSMYIFLVFFFGILIRKLVSWDGSCIVPTILCYIRKECSNTGGLEATRIYEDWLFSYFTILKISSENFVKLQRPTSWTNLRALFKGYDLYDRCGI